jgi:hypothetical protein
MRRALMHDARCNRRGESGEADEADEADTTGARGSDPVKALEDPDAILLHQVHPVKLAADAGAAALSFWLLWKGRTRTGFAVHYLVPLAASAFVLTRDVSYLRATSRGRYVLDHMPPPAQGIRALGDTVMVRGARKHQARWMVAGAFGVAAGWAHGLLPGNHAGPGGASS